MFVSDFPSPCFPPLWFYRFMCTLYRFFILDLYVLYRTHVPPPTVLLSSACCGFPLPSVSVLLFLIPATPSEALCQISRQVPWQALCLLWQLTMVAELEPKFLKKKVCTCTEIVIKWGGGRVVVEAIPSPFFCGNNFRFSKSGPLRFTDMKW